LGEVGLFVEDGQEKAEWNERCHAGAKLVESLVDLRVGWAGGCGAVAVGGSDEGG